MEGHEESSSHGLASSSFGAVDEISLESLVVGDIRKIKERLKAAGQEETLIRLKDEYRTIQNTAFVGNGCSGGASTTSERVQALQHALEYHLAAHRSSLKDTFANYLDILIAIKYSMRVLFLTKSSKRTIGDLVEILLGNRCLNCCSLFDEERFCRGCMCALCKTFDEELVIDRFRNKTKTGRWLQCPSPSCGCYVHADGAIAKGHVRCVPPGADGSAAPAEGPDCVRFVCPCCFSSAGLWEHIKDILTQSGGVKKKDMGKLMEEVDRVLQMTHGAAASAPYASLRAKLLELKSSNEGVNKTIAELRSFFGVTDRRSHGAAGTPKALPAPAALPSAPPAPAPSMMQLAHAEMPGMSVNSTPHVHPGAYDVSEGVPATSAHYQAAMMLPYPFSPAMLSMLSGLHETWAAEGDVKPTLAAVSQPSTEVLHIKRKAHAPVSTSVMSVLCKRFSSPTTSLSGEKQCSADLLADSSGAVRDAGNGWNVCHVEEGEGHRNSAPLVTAALAACQGAPAGRRQPLAPEAHPARGERALSALVAAMPPMEQTFVAAIVGKVESRRRELQAKRAKLDSLEASLRAKEEDAAATQAKKARKIEERHASTAEKLREAEDLEARARAARAEADAVEASESGDVLRIEADFDSREAAVRNEIAEERKAKEVLWECIKEEEVKLVEMEEGKESLVANVRSVMHCMVREVESWGS
eukprot:jgi/Mesen1/3992/ME000210S03229